MLFGVERLESEGEFRFSSNGGTPFDPSDDARRRMVNNDISSLAFITHARLGQVAGGQLALSMRSRDRDRGLPGTELLPSQTARLFEDELALGASWARESRPGALDLELVADGTILESRVRDLDADLALGSKDQTSEIESAGFGVLLRGGPAERRWLARFDARHETGRIRDDALDVADRGGLRRNQLAGVFEWRVSRGAWVVAPSLRYEWRDDSAISAEGVVRPLPVTESRDGDWTGKIALARALSERWALRASIGRFVRVPNLLELFGDRGFVRGSLDLREESGLKLELGVSASGTLLGARYSGELVAYATDAEDLIVFEAGAGGSVVARNIEDVEIRGIEAQLELNFGPRWQLFASGNLQDATIAAGTYAGNPVPSSPERSGSLALRWRPERWELDYEINYLGGNSASRANLPEDRMPGRAIHDLRVARRIGEKTTLGLEVRNLFDREFRDLLYFPLPGRQVYFAFGYTWGEVGP